MMNGRRSPRFFILVLDLAALAWLSYAAPTIAIIPKATVAYTIGTSDLIAGAGSDLNSSYPSSSSAIQITITNTGNKAWTINVHKNDTSWDSRLHLKIMRTSSGSGPGSVIGGMGYIQLTDNDQPFFAGSGDNANIPVQVLLDNVSVQIPASSGRTSIVFTIVDGVQIGIRAQ